MTDLVTPGLKDGQVLMTPVGLVLTGDIDKEQMTILGYQIGGMLNSLQFAAGDFLLECDKRFGHEADQVMESLGISLESRAQYRRTSDAIPIEMRVDGISWSHHRAVAHLDPDQITFYLNEAKREGWPKRVLEAELKKDLGPKPTKALPAPEPLKVDVDANGGGPTPAVQLDWDVEQGEVQRITLRYANGKLQMFVKDSDG